VLNLEYQKNYIKTFFLMILIHVWIMEIANNLPVNKPFISDESNWLCLSFVSINAQQNQIREIHIALFLLSQYWILCGPEKYTH
jgi:hypothetical protein